MSFNSIFAKLRYRLGCYRAWCKDLLALSQYKVQLLEHKNQLQEYKAELEKLKQVNEAEVALLKNAADKAEKRLAHVEANVLDDSLPFSLSIKSHDWIGNAESVLEMPLSSLSDAQRKERFYSYYSEMAGGVGHILLEQYRVYLAYLPKIEGRWLDIGCGAGELLNLLQEKGVPAVGIDLDEYEVGRAREKGLDVIQAEAFGFLSETDERFAVISLLQVIEHLPKHEVQTMVEICRNALVPGGILIIETINLRHANALNCFYTDPTHHTPLSDNYMSFLFQWYGLDDVELVYTLPVDGPRLDQCYENAYTNFAVIGQRAG